MKNFKFYILLPLIFLMASCQKEHDIEFVNLGSEFFISQSDYTSLDNQFTFAIENQQKNLAQVSVTLLGDTDVDLGAITLTEGEGSITFTGAQTGLAAIDDEATFQFGAEYNGTAFTRSTSVAVTDPITVEAPEVTRIAEAVYFQFAIEPATATVSAVKIQTKVSANGTYADVAGSFGAIDSVAIVGADYNLGDTLYVKVMGTAGTKNAATETAIEILPDVAEAHSFTLMMGDGYNLINDTLVAMDDASADVIFIGNYTDTTNVMVGFNLLNAEFVMATEDEYALADRMTIMSADFSTVITMNDNVAGGEMYYFRTRPDVADDYTYGMIKIMNVDKPQGLLEDSYIEFEYKK